MLRNIQRYIPFMLLCTGVVAGWFSNSVASAVASACGIQ